MKNILTILLFCTIASASAAGIDGSVSQDSSYTTINTNCTQFIANNKCDSNTASNGQLDHIILASGDIGQCMGDCAAEQGMCMGQCQGDGQCISRCADAHGRCVARCSSGY
jgi:hypothetical protein